MYYNYGENVYYDDGSVYYGDEPVATYEEYAQQAEAIVLSAPEAEPAAEDWMSLGVYAMTSDGQSTGVEPTMFLQLAVSKQGVINGTFQNTATSNVQAVEGMVDKQTQRAAWTAVGKIATAHGNGHREPGAGYDAGAGAFSRWHDTTVVAGADGGAWRHARSEFRQMTPQGGA